MNIYPISNCRFIAGLTGVGAATYSTRWSSKGIYILYTAATPSLALLESVVHISKLPVTGSCMMVLDIQEIAIADLPLNWQQYSPPDILKKWGNEFVKYNKAVALKLPSAIMPEEYNYLSNSSSTNFKKVKITGKRPLPIDDRLMKK